MNILRRITVAFLNTFFRLALFFAVSAFTFLVLYTDPAYIPRILENNDAYTRFVPSLVETNKDQPLSSGESITLGDSQIRDIVTRAYPADTVEQGIETFISATYAWLEGDNDELSFTIDVRANQQRLAEGLADFAIARLESLPMCSGASRQAVDPFSANCRPEFVDLQAERQVLVDNFLQNPVLFDDHVLTEELLSDNKQDLAALPGYYQLLRVSWIPMLILLVLLGGGIIFLSRTRRAGLRKVGYGMAGTAISLVFFTFIFSFVMPGFTGSLPIFQTSGAGIDALINDVTISFGRDYALTTIALCVPLGVLGLAFILLAKKSERNKYAGVRKKSGMQSSNGRKTKSARTLKSNPPIQSSEASPTKKPRSKKSKKYRTIPKKEL